ncbi:PA2169 family four-helix-bundle protein [Dokdonia sp. Asnod3-C12]|uniref:ferritin-like domain-containing protein n=1 Tax=Dokdonia sp. Asnod3-C12 TaxID=3160575 RepID=UPI0038675340
MKQTTAEAAREQSHIDIVSNLQGILEKNYDAEEGYKEAMLKADNSYLKDYLKNKAATRATFATEISDIILKLNETPKESGSTKGSIHRTWMSIKDAFSSNSDEGILEECIRGDKASIEEYNEVMENQAFPVEITSVLTNQLLQVKKSVNDIKKIEDLF